MLGRHYALEGMVTHGDRRGRQLGFPTANLSPEPDRVVPGDGIYATFAMLDGRRHMAATSIGDRPTFGPGARTVETFIFDFDRDIYDRPLRIEFVDRLRGEMKFDGAEELVRQMKRDVERARSVLTAVTR
jgi:riboflavin kinase/FMN adenylyltransferase